MSLEHTYHLIIPRGVSLSIQEQKEKYMVVNNTWTNKTHTRNKWNYYSNEQALLRQHTEFSSPKSQTVYIYTWLDGLQGLLSMTPSSHTVLCTFTTQRAYLQMKHKNVRKADPVTSCTYTYQSDWNSGSWYTYIQYAFTQAPATTSLWRFGWTCHVHIYIYLDSSSDSMHKRRSWLNIEYYLLIYLHNYTRSILPKKHIALHSYLAS